MTLATHHHVGLVLYVALGERVRHVNVSLDSSVTHTVDAAQNVYQTRTVHLLVRACVLIAGIPVKELVV